MWITLEQINCLNAINHSGSINAAAIELNKAKSAVSYTISRLEEQLGFPVLDRSQYRMALTPQGESFLVKSQKVLIEMDRLKEEVQKISSGIEMKLSLSATAIYPTDKLNSVLMQVLKKFPSTEFTFHREILSGEKMLLNDDVDLAIFENPRNHMDIEKKKIGNVKLKLVVCSSHPYLALPKKQQTRERLSEYPHIIQRSTIADPETQGTLVDAKKWTVSDIDSKKELILNNLGWGRLPDHYVEKELKKNKLFHLEHLDFDHRLEIFICKKRSKAFGPVLKHIWDSF